MPQRTVPPTPLPWTYPVRADAQLAPSERRRHRFAAPDCQGPTCTRQAPAPFPPLAAEAAQCRTAVRGSVTDQEHPRPRGCAAATSRPLQPVPGPGMSVPRLSLRPASHRSGHRAPRRARRGPAIPGPCPRQPRLRFPGGQRPGPESWPSHCPGPGRGGRPPRPRRSGRGVGVAADGATSRACAPPRRRGGRSTAGARRRPRTPRPGAAGAETSPPPNRSPGPPRAVPLRGGSATVQGPGAPTARARQAAGGRRGPAAAPAAPRAPPGPMPDRPGGTLEGRTPLTCGHGGTAGAGEGLRQGRPGSLEAPQRHPRAAQSPSAPHRPSPCTADPRRHPCGPLAERTAASTGPHRARDLRPRTGGAVGTVGGTPAASIPLSCPLRSGGSTGARAGPARDGPCGPR
ncbi:hypothetical protein SA2016_0924 [Sinomonas atrocyanea]|uniref:Uncharacterized protein n=1 Tax=Sinomonas atrocyanea TaxID=37927 RepID=A0A126ZWR2_9MICC|nr:hypothetical protein SA2016_0924 [Sinomonas atrocyanea]